MLFQHYNLGSLLKSNKKILKIFEINSVRKKQGWRLWTLKKGIGTKSLKMLCSKNTLI